MPVQQPKQIYDRGQRCRFSTLIPGERVVAAAGQFGGLSLAEAEFPANPTDLRPLRGTRLENQVVARRGVALRASPVEFDLPARRATPSRQALHFEGHTHVGNPERLAFEGYGAASRIVILI